MGYPSSRSSAATSPSISRRSKPTRAAWWSFVTRCDDLSRSGRPRRRLPPRLRPLRLRRRAARAALAAGALGAPAGGALGSLGGILLDRLPADAAGEPPPPARRRGGLLRRLYRPLHPPGPLSGGIEPAGADRPGDLRRAAQRRNLSLRARLASTKIGKVRIRTRAKTATTIQPQPQSGIVPLPFFRPPGSGTRSPSPSTTRPAQAAAGAPFATRSRWVSWRAAATPAPWP